MSLGHSGKCQSSVCCCDYVFDPFSYHAIGHVKIVTFLYSLHWFRLFFFFISWGGNVEISQNCVLMSARVSEFASWSHWSILTGQFQWWQQWQHQNVLPLKQNGCSTVGYPDSWYATLWLTWNHKSSDPFPFLCNFPSSSICFSFAETKLFTLLFLWKHGIPEGFVGSINHQNGCIVITTT